MNRIAYMVLKNLPRIPGWFYRLEVLGLNKEKYSEEERYRFLRKLIKTVNRSGRVEIVVTGEEHIPEENGFILFPNHQGMFDMLALVDSCPKPLSVVAKIEASNWILVKQVLRLIDGIAMDRSDLKGSLLVINEMTKRVKEGHNFVIFPEGTRSRRGNELLEFKAGTFKSAVNANCPIVPVALIDSFRPFDISSIKKETVQVHFLEPILPEQYMGLKTREIANLVHDKIQEKINEKIG